MNATPDTTKRTSLFLNVASIIIKFLISTIGPKTRNASKEPVENVLLNDEAMNASASEHSDKINESAIITSEEDACPCPIDTSVAVLI